MNKDPYNILLVDDDSFLIDMYSLKFTQAGHHIESVTNADEALEKLCVPGYTPDAVLLDLVMPKMNGFELLEAIQQRKLIPHTALIVLSNQSEPGDMQRARDLGAMGHIIKANAIPSEVLALVTEMIQKYKATPSSQDASTHA